MLTKHTHLTKTRGNNVQETHSSDKNNEEQCSRGAMFNEEQCSFYKNDDEHCSRNTQLAKMMWHNTHLTNQLVATRGTE